MSPDAYNAIKAHLVASVAPVQIVDFDQLEPLLEQSTDNFFVLEEMFSYEDVIAFGDPNQVCMEESGGFTIHCFTPAPESSSAARVLAESVRQVLRFADLLAGNLRIKECDPPEFNSMNDGLWTSAFVNVTYTFTFHTAI
jgi:hypothetical protein